MLMMDTVPGRSTSTARKRLEAANETDREQDYSGHSISNHRTPEGQSASCRREGFTAWRMTVPPH
jgi:hypothetical protein